MIDERAYVARVEAAGADELAHLLAHPAPDEERALRTYLGEERYRRMHSLALRRSAARGRAGPRGNVVAIHGIMGSELTAVDRNGTSNQVWLNALRIMGGWLQRLRLGDDGRDEYDPAYDVRASGILKRSYGELLLSLAQNWKVRAFWFDWRKDLRVAAAELDAQISGWFGDGEPVHIVAHSMGGLAARTFIKNYPSHWDALWDSRSSTPGALGGRLVMLGTPNHGSFSIPQAITGILDTVTALALVDLRHSLSELLTILNSFVGTYQMLPSPLVLPAADALYRADTYGDLNVPQRWLDNARKHHELLHDVVDPTRMIYVAGDNQPTVVGLSDVSGVRSRDAYDMTLRGDGTVPHILGVLRTPDGRPIDTYYVVESHGNLTANDAVLAALDELLQTGTTQTLSTTPVSSRGGAHEDAATKLLARQRRAATDLEDATRLQRYVDRLRTRSGDGAVDPLAGSLGGEVAAAEREAEEIVTRHILSHQERAGSIPAASASAGPVTPIRIEIGLTLGEVDKIDSLDLGDRPVDAIAVGHYIGVKPQAAERALDRAISAALPGRAKTLTEADYLLTQFSERGIIRGELGQPFFLDDPRVSAPAKPGVAADRIIAVCGMGIPGRFGAPELTVLARELCWSLGRMGRRHLATVLIGAGNGNISVPQAVNAWLRGISAAITGSADDEQRRLLRVTFIDVDPLKVEAIHDGLKSEQARLARDQHVEVVYTGDLDDAQREHLRKLARDLERRDERRQTERSRTADADGRAGGASERAPTRITLSIERDTYRFGAITDSASIPERAVPLDPTLVSAANDELAAEWDPGRQLERGQFMERLLLPQDLRAQLTTDAPVVMLLDSTTARIHWEMVAQVDPLRRWHDAQAGSDADDRGSAGRSVDFAQYFLGTSRGFTRQLRTLFAPPPEPPPPPRRVLRVLVIADPAEDARLAGAEEEGAEVADLFAAFNRTYGQWTENRVEVVCLFGPREATRTNVLRHLILHSYDVLHFAGHCVYDRTTPAASGWIFTGGARLSANEFDRIDRIPKFVFSNACESGITPDRSEMRSVELAPSFAESFFSRGVSNFVCTAWPVDDTAARQFAQRVYSGLLGLSIEEHAGLRRYGRGDLEPMHVAMRQARLALAGTANGARTWGAYQHYGNPYLRFFDAASMQQIGRAGKKTAEPRAGDAAASEPQKDSTESAAPAAPAAA